VFSLFLCLLEEFKYASLFQTLDNREASRKKTAEYLEALAEDIPIEEDSPTALRNPDYDETAETKKASRSKRQRSPAYPTIGLEEALNRAESLYGAEGRFEAPLSSVAAAWQYEEKSSALYQLVAALKQFGLAEDSGSGENR